jgi:radial spoke head protein 3
VQIERGDLFDFDLEVKPLIEILVGRSVVSAMNELQEEKEREERKHNLDKYQKKRNAELMVTQRLEAKHKRKLEEAERRRLQKELFVKNQKEAGKKIIARRNAKESLLGLKN